jgi:MoxR-like ATPase
MLADITGLVGREIEQRQVVEALLRGQSVLISGPVGAGKSTLARAIYEQLRRTGHEVVFIPNGQVKTAVLEFAKQAHVRFGLKLPEQFVP